MCASESKDGRLESTSIDDSIDINSINLVISCCLNVCPLAIGYIFSVLQGRNQPSCPPRSAVSCFNKHMFRFHEKSLQLLTEGAVVWLYSKASGKTLRIQENGRLDAGGCNGKFGMYATTGTT